MDINLTGCCPDQILWAQMSVQSAFYFGKHLLMSVKMKISSLRLQNIWVT